MWTCLKRKVTPILGYLIAYLDTNCNLDLITAQSNGRQDDWIYNLWIELLKNPEVTRLSFTEIGISFTNNSTLSALSLNISRYLGNILAKLVY